jgi:hypothetical protein
MSFLVSIHVIPSSHAFMEADRTKGGLMLRVSILSYVKPIHAYQIFQTAQATGGRIRNMLPQVFLLDWSSGRSDETNEVCRNGA